MAFLNKKSLPLTSTLEISLDLGYALPIPLIVLNSKAPIFNSVISASVKNSFRLNKASVLISKLRLLNETESSIRVGPRSKRNSG